MGSDIIISVTNSISEFGCALLCAAQLKVCVVQSKMLSAAELQREREKGVLVPYKSGQCKRLR